MLRLSRSWCAALLLALAAAGCGDERGAADEAVETTIDAIVDAAPRFLREPVRVEGRAVPVTEEWFVLEGERDKLLVAPEPGALPDGVGRGDRVTVLGVVEAFNRLQLEKLQQMRESGRHPALRGGPTLRGRPYVSADSVEPG